MNATRKLYLSAALLAGLGVLMLVAAALTFRTNAARAGDIAISPLFCAASAPAGEGTK